MTCIYIRTDSSDDFCFANYDTAYSVYMMSKTRLKIQDIHQVMYKTKDKE